MKIKLKLPNIALYVFGGYCILQALIFTFFIEGMASQFFNTTPEGLEIVVLMHYGMAPAFLIMGLTGLFATTFELQSKRKVILAFIIGYIPLFVAFNYFIESKVMNAGVETFIPDFICFILGLIAYFTSSK